jgi:putative CocE/NonD family hydrolase
MLNYSGLQNAWAGRPVTAPMKPGQKVTGNYQIVVGPWYHLETLEPPVLADLNNLMLRWYDRWLKGVKNGVEQTNKPAHLYELRSQRWIDTDVFPFTSTVTRQWFGRDNTLTSAPPDAGTESMTWEPSAGYCTRSMDQGNGGLVERYRSNGYQNPCTQDDTASQAGRLTYTSAAFPAAKVLAGPITATIAATSTASEVALVATVEVVSPDGASYPVSTGLLIGSFRANDESRTWRDANGRPMIPYHPFSQASQAAVVPGEVTEYMIEIPSTFARLDPGDRLRVTLTPSDEPMATPTAPQLAALAGGVYEILSGGAHPSVIDIPLVDPSRFVNSTFAWGAATE